MEKQKVLITGGTGFLGCHLARQFLKDKFQVYLYDLSELDAKDLIGKVTAIKGDVRDYKLLKNSLKGIDYVVHTAAALPIQRDKKTIFSVNIDGTKTVLQASLDNKIKKIIFISSTAVYGIPKILPETEEAPIDPIGFYGESKVAAEKLCKEFSKKGLNYVIIRPKTFLGPERLGVFQIWFEAIYNGKPIFILGDGNNDYQLLAVSDIAELISKAVSSNKKNVIINAGAKEFSTWRNDLGAVIKFANSKTKIISLPNKPSQLILWALDQLNLSPITEWHYKTLPVNSYVSIDKAKKIFDWSPKKSNKALLIETYDWYQKNRNKFINKEGKTHRVGWNFGILNIVSKIFN